MKDVALAHDAAVVDRLHVVAVALVRDHWKRHAVHRAARWQRQHGIGVVFPLLVADVAVHLLQVGVFLTLQHKAVVEDLRALAEAEDAEALGLDLLVIRMLQY